ncbi:MAG TPA: hypothetical protein VMC83_24960 [Streptosporangiaceae bacterium]|nr:hypothetical protein [Streptosporangiaceae bacterium]
MITGTYPERVGATAVLVAAIVVSGIKNGVFRSLQRSSARK